MIKLHIYGFVGNLGTKVLIDEKQDELVRYFNQEFITHIKNQIEDSLNEDGFNPSLIMPSNNGDPSKPEVVDYELIGKGGVLAALWKICDRNKWGLRYSLRKIPILQGTIEIANYFDITPYRLLTKNAFIVACRGENDCSGQQFVATHGRDCEIGDITNEKKRVRIDGEAEAFLTKDFKDEIDKVIPNFIKKMGLV